jgi:hypothetical protein
MGGNAAKERRRLKRLAEQGVPEGEKVPSSSAKPIKEINTKSESKKQKLGHVQKSPSNKTSHKKVNSSKDGNKKTNVKSPSKIPIKSKPTLTKKKVKKPKHLARKMQLTQDPKELEDLEKKQKALVSKKMERAEKFKDKVIKMVGGVDNFDEDAFRKIMETGGAKLESIVEASTRKVSKNNKVEMIRSESIEDVEKMNEENLNDASSSPSSSESGGERDEKKTLEQPHVSSSTKSSSSSSSSSNSDENSDDEIDGEETGKRSRGRRRRGLKEADTKREELNQMQQKESTEAKDEVSTTKKIPRSEDKRRCVGRKPLTDFMVGKRYTGTVKYIKPNLGLFIDIGCHSDAFCHISRSSDDYVESLEGVFQEGDVLTDRVRVVDVDRKKKRITVSLQSDEKIKDEEKSQREYNERRQAKLEKKHKMTEFKTTTTTSRKFHVNEKEQNHQLESNKPSRQEWLHEEVPIVIDPDNMTPAELKRARKLQRRQERRAPGIST